MEPQPFHLSEDEAIVRWLGDEAVVAVDSLVRRQLRYTHFDPESEHQTLLGAIFRAMKSRAIGAPASAWLAQHAAKYQRELMERGVLLTALEEAPHFGSYGIVVSQIIYYCNHPELVGTAPYGETVESLSPHVREAAFRVEYRGSAHRTLYNALAQLQDSSSARMASPGLVPVVIGTGMGKSRMVEEMAQHVFTVTIQLGRPLIGSNVTEELNEHAPDHAVYAFLVEQTVGFDSARALARTSAFIAGLATRLKTELETTFERLAMLEGSYGGLVSSWGGGYYQNAPRRRRILLEAIKEAERLESACLLPQALVERMRSAMEELCQTIPNPRTRSMAVTSLKLILAFDEKISQTSYTTANDASPYHSLSKCFAALNDLPVIGLFLSRSPKVLTTSGGSSLKLPLRDLFPFEYDRESELGRSEDEELNNASKLGSMCRFGRPLFFAHLQAIEHKLRDENWQKPRIPPAEYLIGHLRTQLLGGSRHTDRLWEVKNSDTYGPLAVLDVRLALDFDAHTDTTLGASERMVAENMRLYDDPKRPHERPSTYRSEPVLAEAAAQQMWYWRPDGPRSVSLLDVLVEKSKNGLVALDDDDACLVGRYILLLSHDRAIGSLPPNPAAPIPNQPWFSDEVPISRFINSIFTSKRAAQILRCLPDNVLEGNALEEDLRDAFVHFTHFIKVHSAAITLDSLRAAYIRGAAFKIIGRKRPAHCIIPIRIKKGAGLESVFSLMAFTFSNDDTTSPAQMRLDPKAQGYFPEYDQYTRPFIMLACDFMALADDGESCAEDSMEVDERAKEGPSGAHVPSDATVHTVHPRYTIRARGISPDTYNEVNDWDKDKYHYLLTFQQGETGTGGNIFIPPFSAAGGQGRWEGSQ